MKIGDIIQAPGGPYRITSLDTVQRVEPPGPPGPKRLGLRESKIECPICARPVGGVHTDACPRSRAALRALPKNTARLAYLSKGFGFISGPNGEPRAVTNPGFPYVRPRRGVSWAAGGLPLGMDKKAALAFMRREAEHSTTPTEEPLS